MTDRVHNLGVEPSFIRGLYDYSYWAWARLLSTASRLSPQEYQRPNRFTCGSIRGILHSLWAEASWLARWEGREPVPEFTASGVPGFQELSMCWNGEEAKMRAFVEALTPEKLQGSVTYRSTRTGNVYTDPLWQLLVHVANHATQHRAEAAEALTMAGHSPGDLDLLDYFREQRART
jgi:uncharacterized damage-inducible protein DinB